MKTASKLIAVLLATSLTAGQAFAQAEATAGAATAETAAAGTTGAAGTAGTTGAGAAGGAATANSVFTTCLEHQSHHLGCAVADVAIRGRAQACAAVKERRVGERGGRLRTFPTPLGKSWNYQ